MHQSVFEVWRKEFNTERPHSALGMKKPAQVYVKSSKKYRPTDEFSYPSRFLTRQINNRGYVNYRAHLVFLSNAFNGYNARLDIRPKEKIKVWFAKNLLGEIDKNTFIFTPDSELVSVIKIE